MVPQPPRRAMIAAVSVQLAVASTVAVSEFMAGHDVQLSPEDRDEIRTRSSAEIAEWKSDLWPVTHVRPTRFDDPWIPYSAHAKKGRKTFKGSKAAKKAARAARVGKKRRRR